ncbi:MAG: hypothetical protein QXH60_02855, partial [Candidatus Pacearchaeota archaeon]
MKNNEIKFRLMKKGEEKEVLKVYNEIFELNASLKQLKWKYYKCPGGFRIYLALNNYDKVIGIYCNQFKDGIFYGKKCKVLNVVDVCIEEKYRGEYLLKAIDLNNNDKNFFSINFPREYLLNYISKHPIIDNILGVKSYHKMIENKLIYKKSEFLMSNVKKLNKKIKASIDFFWEEKQSEIKAGVIRNSDYLQWRVLESPETMKLFIIKKDNKLIGYFSILIKEKICYITDILILNKYLTKEIIDEIEKTI